MYREWDWKSRPEFCIIGSIKRLQNKIGNQIREDEKKMRKDRLSKSGYRPGRCLAAVLMMLLLLTACGGKQDPNTVEMKNPASDASDQKETTGTDAAGSETVQEISADEALAIALGHAGLTEAEIENSRSKEEMEDGRKIFEVEFSSKEGAVYDYEISAADGAIFAFSYDAERIVDRINVSGADTVTEEQVKQKIKEYLPKITEEEIQVMLKEDDGWMEYEAYVFYDSMQNEFKIDAGSGELLEWEGELPGH